MQQYKNRYHVRDTVLLSGWLFADLLLGLMMIFFVAMPRFVPPPVIPPVPPVLTVSPKSLDLDVTSTYCTGGKSNPQCTIMVGETASSPPGNMTWMASSDMSNTVRFSPASGTLSPGGSVRVTITNFPCQNGSFTFMGSSGAVPVTILLGCTPLSLRLEPKPLSFTLTVNDVNLVNSSSEDQNVKTQVLSHIPLGRRVGLVIAYGGTPDDNGIGHAQDIVTKIYAILQGIGGAFQGATYYASQKGNLFTLQENPSVVRVDIYLFVQ